MKLIRKTISITIELSEYSQIILDSIFAHRLKIKTLLETTAWNADEQMKSVDWDSLVPYKVEMITKIKQTHPDNLDNEGAENVFLNIISAPNCQLYWKSLIQS